VRAQEMGIHGRREFEDKLGPMHSKARTCRLVWTEVGERAWCTWVAD
jgi:hypothetical protein